jgi:CheY-like chemotaxis protein
MKVLFLDDDLNRHRMFKESFGDESNDIQYVETSAEAIHQLTYTDWDAIFLDHDLGGEIYQESKEGTGWEVAKYIAENLTYKPIIIIHSMNSAGAIRMNHILMDGGFKSVLAPFRCLMGDY